MSQLNKWGFDNFKFIVHELFLYGLAILLKYDRLEQANYLLTQQYYVPGNSDYGRDVMINFQVFREYMESLQHRNKRLNLRRLSLRADLLKDRCNGTGIDFRYLMQADFIAFMRAEIEANANNGNWWPETLLYIGHFNNSFEIFARSISKSYFDRVKILLAVNVKNDLEPLLNNYQNQSRQLPRWQFESFNPAALLGYSKLATKP